MSADFAATVASVLSDTGTPPEVLTLEVTESVFLHDGDRALTVLNDLRDLGVSMALDDFGTGYSSLSYLQRFPVDIVKIDKGFIAELGDPTTSAIVSAVVGLSHVLGMSVIAEGVETSDQLIDVAAWTAKHARGSTSLAPCPPMICVTFCTKKQDTMNLGSPCPSGCDSPPCIPRA